MKAVIEELRGFVESWRDDAVRHREPSDPVSDGVASTYDECADELEAMIARLAGKRMPVCRNSKTREAEMPRAKLQRCRLCRCTDDDQCIERTGTPCRWVTPNLCSACADVEKLARDIAERLFTNGVGKRASRLVLEGPNKEDLGGWCEQAVAVQIAKIIVNPPIKAKHRRREETNS